MNVRLTADPGEVSRGDLGPFFEGWTTKPGPERTLAALIGADEVALAWDGDRLVGLATAISDGALFAYLPLVEVLPAYRGEGIGTRLVNDLAGRFAERYGVDLCCDDGVVGFYERLGFGRVNGMVLRRPGALS